METNDTATFLVGTALWAIALVVLLIARPAAAEPWWPWTCVAGIVGGLFGVVTILLLTFYFLVDSENLFNLLVRLFPKAQRQQVANVGHTSIVQNAWHRGQSLSIHGCIYGIKDGRWKSLNTTISGFEQLPPQYRLRPLGEA